MTRFLQTRSSSRKAYCGGASSGETLAQNAAKNGGVLDTSNKPLEAGEPTERVKKLVDELTSITLIEAAQLSTLWSSSYW